MSATQADANVAERASQHSGPTAQVTDQADTLLGLAADAIDHGLMYGRPPHIDVTTYPPALQIERAAFATLLDGDGNLRGCTGSIEPLHPLALAVSEHAFNAAFRDPRFPPLSAAERPEVDCKLSVLTPLEPLPFTSEAELIACLRPEIDGVAIDSIRGRATFLPDVWGQAADPEEFWLLLKRKAGLAPHELPADLRAYRYQTITLGRARHTA